MVSIIGKDESVARDATCKNCGSILRYLKHDVQEGKSYDYGGGCDIVHWINCPGCGSEISVGRW